MSTTYFCLFFLFGMLFKGEAANDSNLKYLPKNIENIKSDFNNLHKYIVNPFMGYFICDQFIGEEYWEYQNSLQLPEMPRGYDILKYGFKGVGYLDILYVQIDKFPFFCNNILPQIDKKFILITGQWQLPQLHLNSLTDTVLNHEFVHLWFSQNPIYQHPKYIAFPYGINPNYIKQYAEQLIKGDFEKSVKVIHLALKQKTHPCRSAFPDQPRKSPEDFFEALRQAQFILSPVGDRPDCYRHWEAIGLGTVPISNVPDLYRDLFRDNMLYISNVEEMLNLLIDGDKLFYSKPNRDVICIEYWKDFIDNLRKIFDP